MGELLLICFSASTTTIVTLELRSHFADVFGATLAAEDRCHDRGGLRCLHGHRHRRHRTGHHLPQADRLGAAGVTDDLKKVAQQPDQRQVGRRHRVNGRARCRNPVQRLALARRGRAGQLRQRRAAAGVELLVAVTGEGERREAARGGRRCRAPPCSSRTSACSGVSPASILPPGNSQRPAMTCPPAAAPSAPGHRVDQRAPHHRRAPSGGGAAGAVVAETTGRPRGVRTVAAIDVDVAVRQVAGPHRGAAAAHAEIDRRSRCRGPSCAATTGASS